MGRSGGEEYTMFTISKPFGYLPSEVEERIKEYELTIGELNKFVTELKSQLAMKDQTISKLQNEMRNLHIEMANITIPSVSDQSEAFVLDQFRNVQPDHTPDNSGVRERRHSFQIPTNQSADTGGESSSDDEGLDDIPIIV